MKHLYTVFLGFFLFNVNQVWAQCPSTSFSLSPSCTGSPVTVTNNTTGATNYNWDFCSGEVGLDSMGNSTIIDSLNPPAGNLFGLTTVFDGTNWYSFVTRNNAPFEVIRMSYSNSLDNAVTDTRFTSLSSLAGPLGIAVFNDGGNWYGLVANANSTTTNHLIRLSFGSSLSNTPTSTALTISGLSNPRAIRVFKENDSLIVAVLNSNRLTFINYGNSILSTLQPSDIVSVNYPQAGPMFSFDIIRDCNNWWGIITTTTSGRVYRTNYGNILFDSLTVSTDTLLSSTSLYGSGGDVKLLHEGGEYKCFFISNTSTGRVYFWRFGSSMANTVPAPTVRAGLNPNLTWNVVNSGTQWYALYCDVSTTQRYVRKFKFANACQADTLISQQAVPGPVTYSNQGPWRASLRASDNTGASSSAFQTVQFVSSPIANFSYNDSCSASAITFTDLSLPVSGSIVSRLWNFGNGVTSTATNPTVVFDTAGVYTVTLTVSNTGGCTHVKTMQVNIKERPDANFGAVAGCQASPVVFTDSSTFISSPITSWNWYFGDGGVSNLQNPLHIYSGFGNFNPYLVVNNAFGCRDTAFKSVNVNPKPQLSVSVNNDCSGFNTSFTNNSSIPLPNTISSFSWSFGDGGTSSQTSPQHQYSTNGNYAAFLAAAASNGCIDTLFFNVSIVNPAQPNFSYTGACEDNAIQFTDLSQINIDTINLYQWIFGDGGTSNQKNPAHVYTNAGQFNVQLCVTTGAGCVQCTTKTINILPAPQPLFAADTVCALNSTSFNDLSTVNTPQSITTWAWSFGNSQVSSAQNPSNIYSNGGKYPVTLTVTTDSLCSATVTDSVVVNNLPVANFSYTNNCNNNSINFTNTSIVAPGDMLVSYAWNFGDSNTDIVANPSHTYATADAYNVTLSVTTQNGCVSSVVNQAGAPNISFTAADSVCAGTAISVNNLSAGFTNYEWDFCSGEVGLDSIELANSISMNPPGGNMVGMKTVTDGTNWYTFVISPLNPSQLWRVDYGNSLNNTPTKTQLTLTGGSLMVQPQGLEMIRENGNWYGLVVNNSNGNITRLNFGATLTGASVSQTLITNPFGILTTPRSLKAVYENDSLIVGVACNTNEKIVYLNFGSSILNTIDAADTLSVPVVGSQGLWGIDMIRDCDNWYTFTTSSSTGQLYRINHNNTLFDAGYTTDLLLNSQTLYDDAGDVHILREGGEYKCFFVSTANGRINYFSFGSSPANALSAPAFKTGQGNARALNVVNQGTTWHYLTLNNTNKVLSNYRFYDACSATTTFSTQANPSSIIYFTGGTQHIALTGSNAQGRVRTDGRDVYFKPLPTANFGFVNPCEGSVTCFIDSSFTTEGTISSYNWNFGDGGTDVVPAPCHTFAASASYPVTLIAVGSNGCADTVTKSTFITENPSASFNYTVTCQRDSAVFNSTSSYVFDSIINLQWNFAGFGASTDSSTVQFIDTFGNIDVSLVAINTSGCADTVVNSIVLNPKPLNTIQVTNTCVGELVQFNNNSSVPLGGSIASTNWNFGDGGTANTAATIYQYPAVVADYNVVVHTTTNAGCTDSAVLPIHIATRPIPDFTVSTVCQGGAIPFNDLSVGTSDTIIKWIWDFGGGNIDTNQVPAYTFSSPGSYNVTLTVVSPTYCDSSITKTAIILPAPSAVAAADTVCSGNATTFNNSSTISPPYQISAWNWNFGDGDTANSVAPQHLYTASGNYNVVLTAISDSGCLGYDTVTVVVNNTPVVDFDASSACSGTTVTFTPMASLVPGDTILAYHWDFGDGDTSILPNPLHVYATTNPYNVQLSVTTQNNCLATVTKPAGALVANFTISDSVCEQSLVAVSNLSAGFSSYQWDFCSGELDLDSLEAANSVSMIPPGGNVFGIKTISDGNNWYTFLIHQTNPVQLWRLDYGNSLNNAPVKTQVTLTGGSLMVQPYGFEVINENGNWYGLVVNGSNGNLTRLNFGSTLASSSVSQTSIPNPYGLLSAPRAIKAIYENDSLILAITGNASESIVLLNFGSSILNAIGANDTLRLHVPGSVGFWGVDVIRDCDQWYTFAATSSSAQVYRLNNGTTFFDTTFTTSVVVTGAAFDDAGDIHVVREGGEYKCFFMSTVNGRLNFINFGNNAGNTGTTPVFRTGQGNSRALNVVNDGSTWYYLYFNNTDKLLSNYRFYDPCNASPAYSTSTNPGGTFYLASGNLQATLVGIDSKGKVKMVNKPVYINPGPYADFGVGNICFGSNTCFSDSSTITVGNISGYAWDFGDGVTASIPSPCHSYGAYGTYNVTLIAQGSNGCSDTAAASITITESPVAAFNYTVGCQRDSALFTDASTFVFDTVANWVWNFGGLSFDTLQNPVTFIDTFGTINVSLVAINSSGCTDTANVPVYLDPKPQYNIQAINTCVDEAVNFVNNTTVPLGDFITTTLWNFGDGGSSTATSPSYQYNNAVADYIATVYNTLNNGCADSFSLPVHIATPPVPNFAFSAVCQNNQVPFIDLSAGTSDTIYKWIWDFGNGVTDTTQVPVFAYPSPGSYNVTLTVVSPTYCDSSITKPVNVLPSPIVTIGADTVCNGIATTFTNTTTLAPPYTVESWLWNFGDGGTDTVGIPQYLYQNAGNFNAVLVAVSDSGCVGIDTAIIFVRAKPNTNFTALNVSCATAPTVLQNQTTINSPGQVVSYSWNFGDNSTDTVASPVHTYSTQGAYSVQLVAVSNEGCADTTSELVEVFAPLTANFSYTGTCLGDTTKFTDLTPSLSVIQWNWSFGNNFTSIAQNPNQKYLAPDTFNVTLRVENAIGCVDTFSREVIIVKRPDADFDNLVTCEDVIYQPADSSTSENEPISQWLWTINNSQFNTQAPAYTFADTGSYAVKLNVSTVSGCTDSITKIVSVKPSPVALFTYSPLYGEAPVNVNFTNQSTGGFTYDWYFGDGDFSTADNPVHTYTTNDTFNIIMVAQSQFGCADTFSNTFTAIPTELDIAVTEVNTERLALPGNVYQLEVRVKFTNVGSRVITDARLFATLGNGGIIVEDWSGLLFTGQTTTYTFVSKFVLTDDLLDSYVCVEAKEVNNGETEVSTDNNRACKTLDELIKIVGPTPNPSEGQSALGIILPEAGTVSIAIISEVGNYVANEVNYDLPKGRTDIELPVQAMMGSIYYIRIKYLDDTFVKKLVVKK